VDPVAVYVCELQPIVVEGLRKVLAESGDFEFAGFTARLGEAVDALAQLQPGIFLIDQAVGLSSILRVASSLKDAGVRSSPVLWSTELSEPDAYRAVQMGVRGVVRKVLPVETLLECLRQVARGQIWMESAAQSAGSLMRKDASRLTPREREVVRLVCNGLKNREIAETLGITPGTVKVHLMHIFEKTGLRDRFALAVHGRNLTGNDESPQPPPPGH
jgi:two-component system, NarL family, nitrate/nitrite response regulator NarL